MRRTIEVLNELEKERVFLQYAIGGAMGAIFYTEPFLTFNLDVFVVLPRNGGGQSLSLAAITMLLRNRGYAAHENVHGRNGNRERSRSSGWLARFGCELKTRQRSRFRLDIFRNRQHLKSAAQHFRMEQRLQFPLGLRI